MKTKKCVSALLLSILMILSLVPTASATESGTATVITENEKAIITVDGTVIEIPVDDSTCEYIAETSVVNDAGVDWVRVDLYSVDENGTRAAIGFATYSWFVSNRTGGMDGYYTLIFQWKASLLLDRIYVTLIFLPVGQHVEIILWGRIGATLGSKQCIWILRALRDFRWMNPINRSLQYQFGKLLM